MYSIIKQHLSFLLSKLFLSTIKKKHKKATQHNTHTQEISRQYPACHHWPTQTKPSPYLYPPSHPQQEWTRPSLAQSACARTPISPTSFAAVETDLQSLEPSSLSLSLWIFSRLVLCVVNYRLLCSKKRSEGRSTLPRLHLKTFE